MNRTEHGPARATPPARPRALTSARRRALGRGRGVLWGLIAAFVLMLVGGLGTSGSSGEASLRLAQAAMQEADAKPVSEREDRPDDDSMQRHDHGFVTDAAHDGGKALAAGRDEGPGHDHSREVFRPPIS